MSDGYVLNACVMIVDDEAVNLKLMQKMLTSQGYRRVILVQESRDVVACYRQNRPDLILLDINMPYLDGYQVMAELKALNDPLLPPIIILTAQHGRDYRLQALSAGARDFIGKPFDQTELLMRVRNLLESQLAHRLLHDQKDVLDGLVRARTEMLSQTRLEIIRRLGRAAEYRDNETGLHIIRMSKIATALAQSLGWNSADCDLILNASPMHDLGKIGISDKILLKPGRFEPDEWEIMKTHTLIGAEILEGGDSDLLKMAREIALCHHEKWDGSGYPYGLAGDAIPAAARISAVADVFDALTSDRPYKKAWPLEKAVSFILSQAGSHFDPVVVEHFDRCLPKILKIETHYAEHAPR